MWEPQQDILRKSTLLYRKKSHDPNDKYNPNPNHTNNIKSFTYSNAIKSCTIQGRPLSEPGDPPSPLQARWPHSLSPPFLGIDFF